MERISLADILIALFILLFAFAATEKLLFFSDNVMAMHKQPLAGWLTDFLIYAIPISELIVVALLMIKRTKLLGLYLFTTMMMIFTGYVALVLGKHYGRIPCSCGGLMKELKWEAHLYINILFTCMGLLAIYLVKKKRGRNSMLTQPLSAG